ncbi:helix-turn-helix transcriptional regulator [Streptococcus suis]|nr:helix-turn-helix transcriptional regulator [Streptococcus suis]
MNQLAQQIKKLRTGQNLSQDDLAEKLYISRQAVSKWENGEATPDIDKLVQLAEIFGVSLDYLVLGKEPENNTKETGTYQTAEQKMDIWQFIAGYWWIVLTILGYLSWFLPHILPSIFG